MVINDIFEIGEIMENEEKDKSIKILDGDNCVIMSKALNKYKIILHMKRIDDGSEGNVFVKLKEDQRDKFPISKALFASRKVVGMTLNQLRSLDTEEL